MDVDAISETMEALVSDFMEYTESDDIEKYPMNVKGDIEILPHYHLENLFCTCYGSKFEGRGYCAYEKLCNEELGAPEPLPDFIEIQFKDSDTYMMPSWLARKKGVFEPIIKCTIMRETEKAYLTKIDGNETWLPKSQLEKKES
jgi:hypothetical protein